MCYISKSLHPKYTKLYIVVKLIVSGLQICKNNMDIQGVPKVIQGDPKQKFIKLKFMNHPDNST